MERRSRRPSTFGKRCAQNANSTLQTAMSADEDCLYLNVDAHPVGRKAPRHGLIHGGGNVGGSVSDPVPFSDGGGYFYSGRRWPATARSWCRLDYRLGVFGFFVSPGLDGRRSKASATRSMGPAPRFSGFRPTSRSLAETRPT